MGKDAPVVKIELDKTRHLRVDFNGLAAFEEETGKAVEDIGTGMSVTELRALVWALLLHEDPELSVRDVGAMLHPGNVQAIEEAVQESFADFAKND